MTYDARETSEQAGAPVELYKFTKGACETWYYTSAEQDISFDGQTWSSTPITRNTIEATPEKVRNNLTLTVPRTNAIAELFRVQPPTTIIALTVYRFHRQDSESVVVWMGRVLNCSFAQAKAELTCEPVSTSLSRTGLRRLYQAQCPHVLYGPGCKVDKFDHAVVAAITAVSGNTITVDALLSKPYAGGFVDWDQSNIYETVTSLGSLPASGPGAAGSVQSFTSGDTQGSECALERRFITAANGLVLTLLFPFIGLTPGALVRVFPGCDHIMTTCSSVYGNIENYGGFPFIPTKNPFAGVQVY